MWIICILIPHSMLFITDLSLGLPLSYVILGIFRKVLYYSNFAFVQASVGEARSAVLVDLVRSVVARWEMHCDSLIEEPPSHLIGPIIHEPPRRVFLECKLKKSH